MRNLLRYLLTALIFCAFDFSSAQAQCMRILKSFRQAISAAQSKCSSYTGMNNEAFTRLAFEIAEVDRQLISATSPAQKATLLRRKRSLENRYRGLANNSQFWCARAQMLNEMLRKQYAACPAGGSTTVISKGDITWPNGATADNIKNPNNTGSERFIPPTNEVGNSTATTSDTGSRGGAANTGSRSGAGGVIYGGQSG